MVLKRDCTGSSQIKPSDSGDENEITHKFPINSFQGEAVWTPFYPVYRVSRFVNKSAELYNVPASKFAASATEGHRRGRLV